MPMISINWFSGAGNAEFGLARVPLLACMYQYIQAAQGGGGLPRQNRWTMLGQYLIRRRPCMKRLLPALTFLLLSYFVSGALSMKLAVTGGYASPIFLPAGIALAFTLVLSYRSLFVVWLGSFALNLWVPPQPHHDSILLAAGIAIGATIQAGLGCYLVRLRVHKVLQLRPGMDSLWLLLVGGPIACLVSASVGTGALLFFDAITPVQYFTQWWVWWVGDTIGVLIVTPLLLMFWPGVDSDLRSKRVAVIGVVAFALSCVAVMVYAVNKQEAERIEQDFIRRANVVHGQLQSQMSGYEDYLNAIARFVEVTPDLDGYRFRAYVKDLYLRYPGLTGMSWLPLVTLAERYDFESDARTTYGESYAIRELDGHQQLVVAGVREQYFPVLFIEPLERNKAALGLDISSEPVRRRTLEKASLKDAKLIVSPLLALVQLSDGNGQILVRAIHGADASLRGHVSAIFSLRSLTATALQTAHDEGVTFAVNYQSDDGEAEMLEWNEPASRYAPGSLQTRYHWQWAGREYWMQAKPTAAFMAGVTSWRVWVMFASGLLLASVLEGFLLALPGKIKEAMA